MSKPKSKVAHPGKHRQVAAPSLAQELAASAPRAKRGWKLSPEAVADVEECIAANKDGRVYISAIRLARALKAKYDLGVSVGAIQARLSEMAGGAW